MKDTKSITILLFALLIGVQQWEHRTALRKSQDQTRQAIAAAEVAQEGWRICLQNTALSSPQLLKGTREENGITYYLSRDGEWHVNRVVGEFYLNDKTQTWEEFKP